MISIAKLVICLLLLVSCGLATENKTYDPSALINATNYYLPFTNADDVLAYGKEKGIFNEMPRDDLISQGYREFKIHISQDADKTYWHIHYHATGLIPTFSCVYRYSRTGQKIIVPTSSGCSYNK